MRNEERGEEAVDWAGARHKRRRPMKWSQKNHALATRHENKASRLHLFVTSHLSVSVSQNVFAKRHENAEGCHRVLKRLVPPSSAAFPSSHLSRPNSITCNIHYVVIRRYIAPVLHRTGIQFVVSSFINHAKTSYAGILNECACHSLAGTHALAVASTPSDVAGELR
jgi:hypothetical protein